MGIVVLYSIEWNGLELKLQFWNFINIQFCLDSELIHGRVSACWKNFNTEFMERFKGYVYKTEPNSMPSISFIFVFISRRGDALSECCIVAYILEFSSSLRFF